MNDEIFHLFMTESNFVSIISMPNQRSGEAVQFLQMFTVATSDLKDSSVLKMLIRLNKHNGELDLYLPDGEWTSCTDSAESSNW